MLYITGEYIETQRPEPEVSRWTVFTSYFVPRKVTATAFGADYVRRLELLVVFRIRWGYIEEVSRSVVATQDYREKTWKRVEW